MAKHVASSSLSSVAADRLALLDHIERQASDLLSVVARLGRRNDSGLATMHARLDALAGDNR